jgi:hypothetical protein
MEVGWKPEVLIVLTSPARAAWLKMRPIIPLPWCDPSCAADKPMFSDSAVQQLRKNIRGELVQPGDAVYDATRKVWNKMIDKRPTLIVRCLGTADVIRSVEFAREHSLA